MEAALAWKQSHLQTIFFYDAYLYSYKDESVFYGEPYLISAEKEGFPIATSASVIPKPVQILLYEIDTTTFFDQQGLNTWNGDNKLSVTFQDVEGESFYGLRLKTMVLYYGFNYETQTEEIDTVDRYVYLETENPIVEDYMNSSKELVFTDQSFAGKEYNFVARFSGNDIQGADLVTIEFLTITEAYYAYKSSQRLQEWVDGDFGVVADKIRRGAGGQQIPDKGFLPSANSGMTGFYRLCWCCRRQDTARCQWTADS
jgi:hypothetical protein